MPIQFACPSCARGYSVNDELAGKSAKCGQCGHKMKIPGAAAAPSSAAVQSSKAQSSLAPLSAAKSSTGTSTASVASANAAPTRPTLGKPAAIPAARQTPVKAPASDPGTSSWLDEELETARVQAKVKPQAPPSEAGCPSCNGPMMPGAVICVKCGYDTRIRGRRSVEHADENDAPPKRSKLGHMGSLLRGSFFSFLAAMLGAMIWAVLAYLTDREFGFVAWGLGGLAGLGMALGHEDDDGTFAGIIAAFMSLVGIVAAKVFIVVIFIAAIVSSAVSELKIEPGGEAFGDPMEMQRSVLAMSIAAEDLKASGQNAENIDEARFEQALEKARGEVAELSPEEIEARLEALSEEQGFADDGEEFADESEDEDVALAEDEAAAIEAEAEAFEEADEEVTFGSVVGSLFGPMDGLFILLAFFTAYKVGAGISDD